MLRLYVFKSYPNEKKERSPYDVLGVSESSSWEEISIAYKNAITKYHPDKVSHMGPELRKLAEEKSTEINRAYESLKKKYHKK